MLAGIQDDSLSSHNNLIESILLIDEFDATIHPALQINLLDIARDFAQKYKIQIIATTHSLSLLEYSIRQNDNIIYLIDNINEINQMERPDIFRIKMDLKTQTKKDIYLNKRIPIFTEDAEARTFINAIFDFWQEIDKQFRSLRSYLYLVEVSFSCETLRHMFGDKKLDTIIHSICVLDGDKSDNLSNNTITLPGKNNPEQVLFTYAEILYNENSDFWKQEEVINFGLTKKVYIERIQKKYREIIKNIEEKKAEGKKTEGELRQKLKDFWHEEEEFILLVLRFWVNDSCNNSSISAFMKKLNQLFRKCSLAHGINNNDWDYALGDKNE